MSAPTNSRLNHLSAAEPNVIVWRLIYLAVIGSDSNMAWDTVFYLRVTPKTVSPWRGEALPTYLYGYSLSCIFPHLFVTPLGCISYVSLIIMTIDDNYTMGLSSPDRTVDATVCKAFAISILTHKKTVTCTRKPFSHKQYFLSCFSFQWAISSQLPGILFLTSLNLINLPMLYLY